MSLAPSCMARRRGRSGIGSSRFEALCAINCFGAPLVGARGFLGFRPLLFGMEREPAAPAGSTLFTFQDIAEYTGWVDQDHATTFGVSGRPF